MKKGIVTQEIIDSFYRRRTRHLNNWERHNQLERRGIMTMEDVEKYRTFSCKGCEEPIKAGEIVCVIRMGGIVAVHDRKKCIEKFREKHSRWKKQVEDWAPSKE